jgi:hypothetical protein
MPTCSNTYKVQTNTIQSEVFEVMKNHRNKTSRELHEFLPHLTLQNVSAAVNALKVKGLVAITDHRQETSDAGNTTTHRCYSVDLGKIKKSTPPSAQPDLFGQLIKTLEAEVAELERWKEDALLRYPDLAADPLLLRARALLAVEAKEDGNERIADELLAGKRDNAFSVRALVKVLGESK